jgi:hypothetical protein
MNFQEAVDRACEEPTLLDALSWIAVWESERVIPIAHRFLNGEIPRNDNGTGWTTCFKFLIKEVLEQYGQQKTLRKLKAIK